MSVPRIRAGLRDVLDRIFPVGGSPTGERDCLVHGGTVLTYNEVGRALRATGDSLARLGLRPQEGVAILCDNNPQYVIGMLAALYFGYRLTPLQVKASRPTWEAVVADSASQAVIHGAGLDADAEYLRAHLSSVRIAAAIDELARVEAPRGSDAERPEPAPDDPAMISFTGGTTGRSKGVVQTYRVVEHNLLMELTEWPWPENPRLIVTTPLSHGAGYMVLPTLYRGGAVITGDFHGAREIACSIADSAADSVFLVPSLIYKLLDLPADDRAALRRLKLTVYGASPILPARLADVLANFGGKIVQLYGQTEAPMIVTTLDDADHRRTDRPELLRSCGRPVAGVSVRLVADGQEVAPGEVGEIWVSGSLVTAGYWRNPKETGRTFVGGWLRTGDLAYRDDEGYLFLVGRSKEMFISGGFNIYPKEVEDVLGELPGVVAAAVLGIPDPVWGEASTAFVVAPGLTAEQIRAHVRERKGPILVPKVVEFVDALPLTDVGKPDKPALRAQYLEQTNRVTQLDEAGAG